MSSGKHSQQQSLVRSHVHRFSTSGLFAARARRARRLSSQFRYCGSVPVSVWSPAEHGQKPRCSRFSSVVMQVARMRNSGGEVTTKRRFRLGICSIGVTYRCGRRGSCRRISGSGAALQADRDDRLVGREAHTKRHRAPFALGERMKARFKPAVVGCARRERHQSEAEVMSPFAVNRRKPKMTVRSGLGIIASGAVNMRRSSPIAAGRDASIIARAEK